jgi:hypothetical protein
MDEFTEDERWALLDQHCDRDQVVARSELAHAAVLEANLLLDPDWDPERHVNILGWKRDTAADKSSAQVLLDRQRCIARAQR